jgi:hypothetical protein
MSKQTNIEEWIDKLSKLSNDGGRTNFDLLITEDKDKINSEFDTITQYLKDNVDSAHGEEEQHSENFLTVLDMFSGLRENIKHTRCNVSLSALEIKTISKLLRQKVQYNNVSVFYGIHLKKYLLDKFPKTGNNDFELFDIEVSFTNAMAVYNLLETIEVTGLSMETYAFGNILFNLSEVTKIYKHYDDLIKSTDNVIGLWNQGINPFEQPKTEVETPTLTVDKED